MKEWLTAAEIAALDLPGLPSTKRGLSLVITREQWPARERYGRGGGYEYPLAALPDKARLHYLATAAAPALPAPAAPVTTTDLRDHQRRRLEARAALLQQLDVMTESAGRNRAIRTMVDLAARGALAPHLQALVPVANARAGEAGARTLSVRTLKRWLSDRAKGATALAPRDTPAKRQPPAWGAALLTVYARPQKPALRACLELLAAELPPNVPMPSYDQARRFLKQMSVVERNRGRMGPRGLKSLRAFTRRDASALEPLDVVSMDGHTFDAEVAHPRHGRPFRPEVTTIIDVASRKVIGWSVALAESQHAVMDALRHAATSHGVPAILYVDRGAGYEGHVIAAPVIGLLARLGTRHETSLPYNSQARGVIERAHRTLWVRAAKQLPTFIGADMDAEAKKKVHMLTRAAIKARSTSPLLMPWMQFLVFVQDQVDAYNARPHRSLPKADGRHLSPAEAYARWLDQGGVPQQLSKEEADDLFRPSIEVTTRRGEVVLFGNIYFNRDLEHRTGERLVVAYDIHDPSRVWVKDHDGRLLCEAMLDGNKRAYFPKSVVEQAREQRAKGRLRRLAVQIGEVQAELGPAVIEAESRPLDPELQQFAEEKWAALAPPSAANDPAPASESEERPVFHDDASFARWCLAHRDRMTEHDKTYLEELLRSWSFRQLIGFDEPAEGDGSTA